MRVIDPGHLYRLRFLDGDGDSGWGIYRNDELTFVKREGDGYPGNVGHHPGTTLQEVLRACIDRVKYLDNQIPAAENADTIQHLRDGLMSLEYRAARRHGRLDDFRQRFSEDDAPELLPVCQKCLHIGCEGACRP